MAEPTEAGHHLVGDVEDVIVAADLADALQIAIRRHHDAARGLHRLADEGADPVGADARDRVAELIDQEIGERLDAHALRPAERVGRRQLDDQLVGAIHPVAVARAAIERGRQIGRAVIGAAAAEDQLLFRPPAHIVVELHEAQCRLHRRGAAGGEEDMAEIARRMTGDAHGKLRRWRVHRVPRRVVGQRHRLVVHHLGQFLAAVADIDAPHAGRSVDQPFARASVM